MTSWLEKKDIEMYSMHNERKYVVAERFLLLEPQRIKFINTWLQYQKMCLLIN